MFARDAQGRATLAGVRLAELAARAGVATPFYAYDLAAMADEARALAPGFGSARHLIAYAVKANTSGPVVRTLGAAGCGCEVGSLGELEVALGCGVAAERILMSGVAKTDAEIDRAIGCGVLSLQLDAVGEIGRVQARAAALGRKARVALRVNPDVAVDTHAHIATGHDEAKFGIAYQDLALAWDALAQAPELELVGLGSHVGSQLVTTDAYLQGAERLFELARVRENASAQRLEVLDLGGGFGIDYGDGCAARPADFAVGIAALAQRAGFGDRLLVVEPGRALVGPHGVLVASVVCTKRAFAQHWLMIDAGMNDLLRPALYGARHRIEPEELAPAGTPLTSYRVVGPVCESADDFGCIDLPDPPCARVAIRDAGAYGYTMASHYNGRALAPEICVMPDGALRVSRSGDIASWVRARLEV